eukprot:767686-Hanusia_phi.AAC.4
MCRLSHRVTRAARPQLGLGPGGSPQGREHANRRPDPVPYRTAGTVHGVTPTGEYGRTQLKWQYRT